MSEAAEAGDEIDELVVAASGVACHAYAPYSKFNVGCALRTVAGSIFTGCNVENASYGLTLCAERSAIAAAVASEGPGMKIAALAVVVVAPEPFPPCGACRQVIAEFADPATPILYAARPRTPAAPPGASSIPHNPPTHTTLAALLPQTFKL